MDTPLEIIVIAGEVPLGGTPQHVRLRDWEVAQGVLLNGDIYIRHRKYIGLKSSGNTPWAVIRKVASHL